MKKRAKYGPITNRARKVVDDYLRVAGRRRASFEVVSSLTESIGNLRHEILPAFGEAMRRDNARDRFVAAWMILLMKSNDAMAVSARLRREAEQLVVNTLATGDEELKSDACFLLAGGGVPELARAELLELLSVPSEETRFCAAGALANLDPIAPEALEYLGKALVAENDVRASMAALALLSRGLRIDASHAPNSPSALEVLAGRFPRLEPEVKYHVVNSLRPLGSRVMSMAPAIRLLVEDSGCHRVLRGRAAAALGCIDREDSHTTKVLLDALWSDQWELVYGAAEGLSFGAELPCGAVDRLCEVLSHPEVDMRRAAVHGLELFGNRASAAIPSLIQRIPDEDNEDVCRDIVTAFGAIGAVAAVPLVELLRAGDPRCLAVASACLLSIGAEAVPEILRLLQNSKEQNRSLALVLLRDLRRNAASAAAPLAKMLDETTDETDAYYFLAALREMRWWSAPASPAVIRCLLDGDMELMEACQEVLWNMGPEILQEVEAVALRTDGLKRIRLEEVLAGLRAIDDRKYAPFERVDQVELVQVFVEIGRALRDLGPMSWSNLAKELARRFENGELSEDGFAVSASALRTKMETLETALSVKLTTSGNNKKGSLSDDGVRLLPVAERFLERKRRRANSDGGIT